MENNTEWSVSQQPPERMLIDEVGQNIRRGLAEIALRIERGRATVWQDKALCSTRSVDAAIFEPPRQDLEARKVAAKYCASCPVSANCDLFVKGRPGGGMVWAGKLRA